MSQSKVPNQLLVIRRKHGLSRKQVAAALGCSQRTVSHYEQGSVTPRLGTLLQLEVLYQLPVAYLYQDLYAELRERINAVLGRTRRRTAEEVPHA